MACAVVAIAMGGFLGLIAAFFMGKVDNLIMRIMDVFQAIPGVVMVIVLVAAIGTGTPQLVFAISFGGVPLFAKNVRAAVLTVRGSEYIEASRTIGASNIRLMFRHILPNCVGHVIIGVVSSVAGNIMIISTLSFIGLGIQPPTPEWGSMLADGRGFISSFQHMVVFPGLFIMITVYAFMLLGDGVRDALDPKLK
jgi:peptide/nickel transport system permease protein